MKPLLILSLVSLIAFNHCENVPVIGEKKKPATLKKFNENVLFVCFIGRFMEKTETKIIDNKDGTIALAEISTRGTNYCLLPLGKTESINVKYYIKKCIQGQVYRSAQNDCKGTGTAANYWGAQKFQRCPTNNTCLDSVSDSQTSCANETLRGLKWRPDHFRNGSNIELIRNYFKSRADEILSTSTDYYWNYLYSLSNVNGDTPAGTGFVIDSFNYVLCFQNQS